MIKKLDSRKTLTLVTTPIGQYEDISLRALKALQGADCIVCEEYKPARRLLKYFDIPFYEGEFASGTGVYLHALNENSTLDDENYLRQKVFPSSDALVCISDCGSPVFEDPGHRILSLAEGYTLLRLPGVTCLGALMMYLPAEIKTFQMCGFLPRKTEARQEFLKKICKQGQALFLMETPYRLHRLLEDLRPYFTDWNLLLGYNLTLPEERVLQGPFASVLSKTANLSSAEFCLFLYPATGEHHDHRRHIHR